MALWASGTTIHGWSLFTPGTQIAALQGAVGLLQTRSFLQIPSMIPGSQHEFQEVVKSSGSLLEHPLPPLEHPLSPLEVLLHHGIASPSVSSDCGKGEFLLSSDCGKGEFLLGEAEVGQQIASEALVVSENMPN